MDGASERAELFDDGSRRLSARQTTIAMNERHEVDDAATRGKEEAMPQQRNVSPHPIAKILSIAKRGAETWGFHESPSFPRISQLRSRFS